MTDEGRQQRAAIADRRWFLRAAAAGGLGLASHPATAQSSQTTRQMPMHGVLGAAGAGPGRPRIAMLVHPGMVMQDFIGPLTVFNLVHAEIHLVWKKHEPVMTEVGLPITPSTPFADCPSSLDVPSCPAGSTAPSR